VICDPATLRRAAATSIFLGAILDASAGFACCRLFGDYTPEPNPHDPNTFKAAPPPGGSADLKTCDKGLVWDAKKKKCIIKRSGAEPGLTICFPGQVWDMEHQKCLERRSGVLSDPDLTEYAVALTRADRYQEAIDVLDLLENPNTPVALNYRGYATRKLGRTDEGISYYLRSVALDPAYPQVREYLGEAYVIQGKFDLAKEQLATIEKLCGSKDCEYYRDLAEALERAHAL
jgi:tetratricopeptide (TPR) repeat protein